MSRIKLDVEQMMGIATKYEQQCIVIDELVRKLDQMLQELQLHWEGASAKRFEQHYYEFKPAVTKMREVIDQTSKSIRHTAMTIQEVDSMVIG